MKSGFTDAFCASLSNAYTPGDHKPAQALTVLNGEPCFRVQEVSSVPLALVPRDADVDKTVCSVYNLISQTTQGFNFYSCNAVARGRARGATRTQNGARPTTPKSPSLHTGASSKLLRLGGHHPDDSRAAALVSSALSADSSLSVFLKASAKGQHKRVGARVGGSLDDAFLVYPDCIVNQQPERSRATSPDSCIFDRI